MNRILKGICYALSLLIFIALLGGVLAYAAVLSNNDYAERECNKMNRYGYVTLLEEDGLIMTCYIIMEDGTKILSSDYVISDQRNPRMRFAKKADESIIQLNYAETREQE